MLNLGTVWVLKFRALVSRIFVKNSEQQASKQAEVTEIPDLNEILNSDRKCRKFQIQPS